MGDWEFGGCKHHPQASKRSHAEAPSALLKDSPSRNPAGGCTITAGTPAGMFCRTREVQAQRAVRVCCPGGVSSPARRTCCSASPSGNPVPLIGRCPGAGGAASGVSCLLVSLGCTGRKTVVSGRTSHPLRHNHTQTISSCFK